MDKCKLILKESNIKCTKARLNILKIIIKSEDSLSVDYMYECCKKQGIELDLSTVYRTLDLFEGKEIVEKFDLGEGKYNYMYKGNSHKHVIRCKLCDKRVEIDCPMPQVKEMIKNKTGFTLIEEEIKFNGICEECKKKQGIKK
ncbi:Fur family transcriptional regulator [Haloimpatiens sp. FM7330]|uniref:Fur family transcriptional regulator n=1 Tax=Haloimpatiens sp. FM7330 TaxID=3298610 RepID=UPI00363E7D49